MKWYFAIVGFLVVSLLHAQSFKKLAASSACNDIDSLCHWYVDQTAAGCDHEKSVFFRRLCDEKKASYIDSVSIHQFALDLAELMSACNDSHFALDWIYLNRKFPRGNGFFPYWYTTTRGSSTVQLVLTDASPTSEIHGAEWIGLNGMKVSDLIAWAGRYVSVEDGAELSRDYLAACWLPWLLAQSDYFLKENEMCSSLAGMDSIRTRWSASDVKPRERKRSQPSSLAAKSEITFSIHNEKAILSVPTFAPKNMRRSLRKIDGFFRLVQRKGVGDIMIDLRNNGGGNSAFVEYLYSFLDTAGATSPGAIIQRSSGLAKKRLQPWLRNGKFRRRYGDDEDAMAAMRLLHLPDATCDTVYFKERILQKKERVYNGVCVVAINGQTASAAAYFTALMQRNKRGQVIGQSCNANASESGGNALPVILGESGIRVFIPLIRYIYFDIDSTVRKAIRPDLEIWPSMHDISHDLDPIIKQFLRHE